MKLSDQVCTLLQAKKLKELGIIQFSLFYHIDNTILGFEGTKQRDYIKNIPGGIPIDAGVVRYYSAFTASELGLLLGKFWEQEIVAAYKFDAETEAQERAHYLIGALQSIQLSAEECNKRLTDK